MACAEQREVSDEVHFQLGDLSARIKVLEESNARLEAKIDGMREIMSQALGGLRAAKTIGAVAVTLAGIVGAAITRVFNWFQGDVT